MEHNLDFEIYTRGNPEVLILIDTSEVYEFPGNQIVEIAFPNAEVVYRDYYNIDKPTVLTTKSLGYSPNRIDFPDGLYDIRISVAPNEEVFKCKKYLKVDRLTKELAQLLEGCVSDKEISEYMEIDKYLTAAQIIADTNPSKSIDLFNLVNKKLNKFKCNK